MENQTVFGDRNPACLANWSRHSGNDGGSAAMAGLLLRGDGELFLTTEAQRRGAEY